MTSRVIEMRERAKGVVRSERRTFRVDLDHRAMLIAARRHEGTFERAERKALAAHEFCQDLSNVLRLTGP